MRILVVSDTHGESAPLQRVLLSQPKAEVVIHLGDGVEQAMEERFQYPEKMFTGVRGNCDYGSSEPIVQVQVFQKIRIFYTHGHRYQVKLGMQALYAAAREQKADVLLFGHTHVPFESYQGGMHILNPGALHGYHPTYGIVDITDAGVVAHVIRL